MTSWRRVLKAAPVLGALWLSACGEGNLCPPGVPCGPVPRFEEPQPGPVSTDERFAAIALGNWHSCMLDTTGAAWCWGSNEYGQLGAATTQRCMSDNVPCSPVPLRVDGHLVFAALTAAGAHTCGLDSTGAAWCWGNGPQLGDASAPGSRRTGPGAVAGSTRFTQLSAGVYGGHTCGLATGDASPWCWGTGFGYGSSGPAPSAVPQRWQAAATVSWTQLWLGEAHACGLDGAGQAWCIGSNAFGQLGDGRSESSPVPVAVSGGRSYRALAVGASHACGLTADGQAWCWGFGPAVGDGGNFSQPRRVPVPVAGAQRFTHLSAGAQHTCGLTADGSGWCWGAGYNGMLGDGATVERGVPVAVAGGQRWLQLTAGGTASCGITTAGSAWCWGWNEVGTTGRPIVGR